MWLSFSDGIYPATASIYCGDHVVTNILVIIVEPGRLDCVSLFPVFPWTDDQDLRVIILGFFNSDFFKRLLFCILEPGGLLPWPSALAVYPSYTQLGVAPGYLGQDSAYLWKTNAMQSPQQASRSAPFQGFILNCYLGNLDELRWAAALPTATLVIMWA